MQVFDVNTKSLLKESKHKFRHAKSLSVVSTGSGETVYVGCSTGLFMIDAELEEVTNLTENFKAKCIQFDGSSRLAVLGKSKQDGKWYLYEYSVEDTLLLSKRAIPAKFVKERKWGCFWGCLSVYQDYWVVTMPVGLLVDANLIYHL